jgi:hypothetical protein
MVREMLLLVRWIRRTVKKGLTIDGPMLFQLLLHLVWYHLLTQAYLTKMGWTVIIIFAPLPIVKVGFVILRMLF